MLACFSGYLDIVKYLRMCGATWQTRDLGGCTALHWAVDGGHLPVIAYMIQDGCEVSDFHLCVRLVQVCGSYIFESLFYQQRTMYVIKSLCPPNVFLHCQQLFSNTNPIKFSIYNVQCPQRKNSLSVQLFFLAVPKVLSVEMSSTFGTPQSSSMSPISLINQNQERAGFTMSTLSRTFEMYISSHVGSCCQRQDVISSHHLS